MHRSMNSQPHPTAKGISRISYIMRILHLHKSKNMTKVDNQVSTFFTAKDIDSMHFCSILKYVDLHPN